MEFNDTLDNFASLISARLGSLLGISFYEDIAECHLKHRVGAVFTFGAKPPKERNIIVFDDFVTTGATMISMRELLNPSVKTSCFLPGLTINFDYQNRGSMLKSSPEKSNGLGFISFTVQFDIFLCS